MAKRTPTNRAPASKPRKAAAATPARRAKASAKPTTRSAPKASKALALRGGRTLQVRPAGSTGRETIELKSRDGTLELKITMTPDGPMIHVKGGSLAVEAADAVSVACKRFDVQASGGISFAAGSLSLESGGELRVRSQGNTYMDSEVIHLNCGDRSAYPPPPEFVMPEEMSREIFGGNAELEMQIRKGVAAAKADGKIKGTGDGCGCEDHQH